MKILEPGVIGSMQVKNRIVMAAMGIRGLTDPDGDWGDRVRAFYASRAAGGVGLITTEMAFVTQELEPVSKQLFSFSSDKHMASLKLLVETLHSYDCKLSVQLTAGFGRVIPVPVIDEEVTPVSASVNTNHYFPEYSEFNTRPLTTEEVTALAKSFGYAAMRCREAGVDCVEIHGHEGYLLDQFMTALWNKRDDRYGGSKEKRLTLHRELIEAIRRDAGEDFPIIFRFGLTHYLENGREEAEGLWIAKQFEEMGVSALHIDAGCYETSWWPHPPQYQQAGCMVDVAEKVKKESSLPIIAVGRLQYPNIAEEVVTNEKADFIAIGRGLLADPEWTNKAQHQQDDEIRPCIGCHEGCLWQMIAGEPTSCSLNPICGHETEWALTKLNQKKSLLVVGGGPGGIEAARVGVERGFDVTLWEASERLGGNLWPASLPEFKCGIRDYLNYLIDLSARLSADIVFNKTATVDDIRRFNADYVLLATGSEMEPLPFKGSNVISAIQVLRGEDPDGERVLIMGGGLVACETALHLSRKGKKVTLCSREDDEHLDTDIVDHNNRDMLFQMLNSSDINILRGAIPTEFTDNVVLAEHDGAQTRIETDHLVFAGRQFPNNELVKLFADETNVFSAGDCVEPNTIMDAVWGCFHAIRNIDK